MVERAKLRTSLFSLVSRPCPPEREDIFAALLSLSIDFLHHSENPPPPTGPSSPSSSQCNSRRRARTPVRCYCRRTARTTLSIGTLPLAETPLETCKKSSTNGRLRIPAREEATATGRVTREFFSILSFIVRLFFIKPFYSFVFYFIVFFNLR